MTQVMLSVAFLMLLLAAAWALWTHATQRAQEPPEPDACAPPRLDLFGGDAERGDGLGGTYDLEDAR